MNEQTLSAADTRSTGESGIRDLYRRLLNTWNERNAGAMASLVAPDGNMVGFDGSQMDGQAAIEKEIARIFADHVTAPYVGKVREVRFLTPDVALLRAVAGQVPPGQSDLNPNTLAIQTLVAVRQDGEWRVALYQNTPAAFHGRPDLRQALFDELRQSV